jgi:hypothetical protein
MLSCLVRDKSHNLERPDSVAKTHVLQAARRY